jgi:hypothetical protein
LCLGTVANAQTVNNGGSLALTGTVEGSILFIFHQDNSGGVTINTGDGTSAAAASLSTVSMFGTADGIVGGTNFTKTKVSGGFTLSGTYKVEVDKANVTSTGFNLGAQMQGSDGITWSVEGSALNRPCST